jgi:hypothetical protein
MQTQHEPKTCAPCALAPDEFATLLERPHVIRPIRVTRPRPVVPEGCNLNVDALLAIRDQILAEPNRFWMEGWVLEWPEGLTDEEWQASLRSGDNSTHPARPWLKPSCGTAACIAGWCTLLFREQSEREKYEKYGDYSAYSFAKKHLRLPENVGGLFGHPYWPKDLSERYRNAQTGHEAALAGAEAIERYISVCGNGQAFRATGGPGSFAPIDSLADF